MSVPAVHKTAIQFVRGFEPDFAVPGRVTAAALTHRFAVIQQTYRADSPDMFFDAALWLCLLDFAKAYAPAASIAIVENDSMAPSEPEAFLTRWHAAEERDPAAIAVRDAGRLVLYIEPELWAQVGGPAPYHDSYTYALYANEDIADRVMAFLTQADAAQGWDLSQEILPPNPATPLWKRLWQRLS